MVGRVCRWKGQLLFLEAAKLASQAKPELYFIAVGGVFDDEVVYMERFRNAADRSSLKGKFIVSDFRSDIREIMNSFDIFVLPSMQPEPFGLVVLGQWPWQSLSLRPHTVGQWRRFATERRDS
jgi:glycosyltransferase involved in cell wall biosynthesis